MDITSVVIVLLILLFFGLIVFLLGKVKKPRGYTDRPTDWDSRRRY